MIFEIFLNNENSIATNIETDAQWSYYPSEEEVLLFPFFAFQVVSNTRIVEDNAKSVEDSSLLSPENALNLTNLSPYSKEPQ